MACRDPVPLLSASPVCNIFEDEPPPLVDVRCLTLCGSVLACAVQVLMHCFPRFAGADILGYVPVLFLGCLCASRSQQSLDNLAAPGNMTWQASSSAAAGK